MICVIRIERDRENVCERERMTDSRTYVLEREREEECVLHGVFL